MKAFKKRLIEGMNANAWYNLPWFWCNFIWSSSLPLSFTKVLQSTASMTVVITISTYTIVITITAFAFWTRCRETGHHVAGQNLITLKSLSEKNAMEARITKEQWNVILYAFMRRSATCLTNKLHALILRHFFEWELSLPKMVGFLYEGRTLWMSCRSAAFVNVFESCGICSTGALAA